MTTDDFQKIAEAAEAARVEVSLTRWGWRVEGRCFVDVGYRGSVPLVSAQRTVPYRVVDDAGFNVLRAEIEFVAHELINQRIRWSAE